MSDADKAPLFFLAAQGPLDPPAAVADLLDRFLHRRRRLARLLSFVPHLIVLAASDAGAVLFAPSAGLLLRHLASPVVFQTLRSVSGFLLGTNAASYFLSKAGATKRPGRFPDTGPTPNASLS